MNVLSKFPIGMYKKFLYKIYVNIMQIRWKAVVSKGGNFSRGRQKQIGAQFANSEKCRLFKLMKEFALNFLYNKGFT